MPSEPELRDVVDFKTYGGVYCPVCWAGPTEACHEAKDERKSRPDHIKRVRLLESARKAAAVVAQEAE